MKKQFLLLFFLFFGVFIKLDIVRAAGTCTYRVRSTTIEPEGTFDSKDNPDGNYMAEIDLIVKYDDKGKTTLYLPTNDGGEWKIENGGIPWHNKNPKKDKNIKYDLVHYNDDQRFLREGEAIDKRCWYDGKKYSTDDVRYYNYNCYPNLPILTNNIKIENGCPNYIVIDHNNSVRNSTECSLATNSYNTNSFCGTLANDNGTDVSTKYSCRPTLGNSYWKGELQFELSETKLGDRKISLLNQNGSPNRTWTSNEDTLLEFPSQDGVMNSYKFSMSSEEADKIYTKCENGDPFSIYFSAQCFKDNFYGVQIVADEPRVWIDTSTCGVSMDIGDTLTIQTPGSGSINNKFNGCNDLFKDSPKFFEWLSSLFKLIRIGTIILTIVLTGIDGVKAFTSFDEKNSKSFYKRLMVRLICVAIVFLIPSIVELFLRIGSANDVINSVLEEPFCNLF